VTRYAIKSYELVADLDTPLNRKLLMSELTDLLTYLLTYISFSVCLFVYEQGIL